MNTCLCDIILFLTVHNQLIIELFMLKMLFNSVKYIKRKIRNIVLNPYKIGEIRLSTVLSGI